MIEIGPSVVGCLFVLLLLPTFSHAESHGVVVQDARSHVALAGQWRFRSGDDLAWAAPDYDDSAWLTRPVPGGWPAGGYPETGQMGWYRLNLKLPTDDPRQLEQLALRMGKVLSAYELYAGGRLLGGVGKLPPLGEMEYDRRKVYPLPQDTISGDGSLVLALRVWGGSDGVARVWRAGPFEGEFSIGNYRQLLQSGIIHEIPSLLLCVLFLGFGLYHLYLYWRNPQLRALMWFGLVAVNIGIYGLMLSQWKYLLDLPFPNLKKIEFGAIYVFPALGIQAIWSLLQQRVGRLLRAYQWSFVVVALGVLLIPGHTIHYQTLGYWQLWALPLLVIGPGMVLRKAWSGNGEARTLVVGLLVFVATCINDLLIDLVQLQTERLAPYGFVAVMLAMAVSLANRFTTMLNELDLAVVERTAELSAANVQLAEAARLDPLTGLLNRRGFTDEAQAEIERFVRNGRPFSLVLADVDHFKHFNDEFGHACGDHLLKRLAAILEQRLRDVDRVARWGGEEFILLLPETEAEGAANLAENLRRVIADSLFEFAGERHQITMTFGVVSYRKGESLDSCIARADTAMYHAKEGGRNKVMIGSHKGLTLVGSVHR